MTIIVLISCASKKLNHRSEAKLLYISTLFKKSLEYAELIPHDQIFILSAKHRLLDPNRIINPYDQTLNKMESVERKKWAFEVLNQLKKVSDIRKDEFVILAGNKYSEFFAPDITNKKIPLAGKRIGKQLQWLNQKIQKLNKSTNDE